MIVGGKTWKLGGKKRGKSIKVSWTVLGEIDGKNVGNIVGKIDGEKVGDIVGIWVGIFVGVLLGIRVGWKLGIFVGWTLGMDVGWILGSIVGIWVGISVGTSVKSQRELFLFFFSFWEHFGKKNLFVFFNKKKTGEKKTTWIWKTDNFNIK